MTSATSIKTVDRNDAAMARTPYHGICRARGCRSTTAGDKKFCIEHLDKIPYVQALSVEIAAREAEEDAALHVRPGDAIDPYGSRAREILEQVAQRGSETTGRIGIEVQLPTRAVDNFVGALERAGLVAVRLLHTRGGAIRRVVSATEAGSRLAAPKGDAPRRAVASAWVA